MATKKKDAAAAASKKSGAATTVAATPGDSLKPATETAASGALIEPDLAAASVPDHPAVDANPRADERHRHFGSALAPLRLKVVETRRRGHGRRRRASECRNHAG